jgi:hypothetical protein
MFFKVRMIILLVLTINLSSFYPALAFALQSVNADFWVAYYVISVGVWAIFFVAVMIHDFERICISLYGSQHLEKVRSD